MSRFLRRKFSDWREWQLFHDAVTKVVGICLLIFFAVCFWLNYQRGEPTTTNLALLAFMAATGMLFNGGRLAMDSWLRRGDTNFQQTQTTTTTAIASAGLPLPDPAMSAPAAMAEMPLDEDGK